MLAVALSRLASLLGVPRWFTGLAATVIALAALSGLTWGIYAHIKEKGAEEVRSEIERQNNEAGLKGGEARLSRRDCVDSGGVWDFRAGKCTRPAPGDR